VRFQREAEFAKLIAQEAGALAINYQRRGISADAKADGSPVTAADRACERLMAEAIAREFPEDGILGEEGENTGSQNGRTWILDPIDGTRDFVRGIPLWGVLIGLEENGQIVAGAAHCPRQGLLLWAERGGGAWANGERIHVSNVSDPACAILSFNGFNKKAVSRLSAELIDWVRTFSAVRSLGGAFDAMLVAQGLADVWIEPTAQPWDLAPFQLLIEEAGGVFSSFDGRSTIYGGDAYACAPGLEAHVRSLLRA